VSRRIVDDRTVRRVLESLGGFRSPTSRLDAPPIHPFPARMPLSVARHLIAGTTSHDATVLDPMAGSGTTLVAARQLGRAAVGFDLDPLAVLVARSATRTFAAAKLENLRARILRRAQNTVDQIELGETRDDLPQEDQWFMRYWFPQNAQKQLFALASAVAKERAGADQDLAWVVFSSLIIAKSVGASFALDLARSRPHKCGNKPVLLPLTAWDRRFKTTAARLPFVGPSNTPHPRVGIGDARSLPIADGSADLVLTSPPYLNAIDYVRAHKFSLLWMGHTLEELRELRGAMIGTERGLWSPDGVPQALEERLGRSVEEDRRRALLRRYLSDLRRVLGETHRTLKPGGLALLVLGPTIISSRRTDAVRTISRLCHGLGLTIIGHATRTLIARRRSLPPPSVVPGSPLADRVRREVIVALRK
jgi:DNA modification methylase